MGRIHPIAADGALRWLGRQIDRAVEFLVLMLDDDEARP